MLEIKIGKIKNIRFGFGGYQNAMFGVSFDLGSEKESWGVGDFWGTWSMAPTTTANWTIVDQSKIYSDTTRRLIVLCNNAKVQTIDGLKGIPVEVIFENMTLKSWRILEEVI